MQRSKGLRYEEQARKYLEKKGLRLLDKNHHCRFGEIDLVMRDRDTVCFIEVKYRESTAYGGAASAVPISKQRRIVKAALFYLTANPELMRENLRFDALLIQRQAQGDDHIEWIRNAFYAE